MKIAILTTDNREHLKDYSNPVPHFGTAPEALLQGFSLLPGVEVHVVSCVRQPMQSPEKLADNIWYHAVLVPKIGWMSTGYQGCIRAVRRKLREIQPDMVHGQGTERECAISAVFSGFPNVLTIHGNMRNIARVNRPKAFSYDWLNAHLEAFTLPRTQGVVCITRYTEDSVRDLVPRTWVVPNAVDMRFFDLCNKPHAVPELLVVGHVCLRKNQNALIRALDSLAEAKRFRVVFLGRADRSGGYGAEFFHLVESRPWCEWAGFLDRHGLRERLSQAALLALPSIEDNCPMVVLEAMAAGVPVIAPNVGGVPDLVAHETNGLLCDPTSPESMAGAVSRILENPTEALGMAQRAREEAIQRFHPRHIALRHLEIYRELLEKR